MQKRVSAIVDLITKKQLLVCNIKNKTSATLLKTTTDPQQSLESIYFRHCIHIMLAMLVTYKKHIVESYTVDNKQN